MVARGASNYGYLVARYFAYAAEACHNHGIDLFHLRVPSRRGHLSHDDWPNGWMGMSFDGWGPPGGPDRGLKDLHDGPIPMMDQQGCVVANSDSHKLSPGDLYELAYYRYRDPAYAWILAHTDRTTAWQSLVWGVPELPEVLDPRASSSHADNVGITALRSQAPGRDAVDQIQAYLKWGIHGGWHGHFDRTALLALSRHGTEFFSPLASWFGYESPLYKAWVQPSISHNMVVVDGLQQEPVPSEQLLFHAGQALQACVVETRARWAQKKPWDVRNPGDLDPHNLEKMIDYGDAAPVTQRRLAAVTDDYVVIADYMHAPQPTRTTGSCIRSGSRMRMRQRYGRSDAATVCTTILPAATTTSPIATGSRRARRWCMRFGTARPGSTCTRCGRPPCTERWGPSPSPRRTCPGGIDGDGRYLADGGFVANAFDRNTIDVDVTGVSALRLTVSIDMRAGIALGAQALGDPSFVTADGGTVRLADLPFSIAGTDEPIRDSAPTRPTPGAHDRRVDLTAAGPRADVSVDTTSLDSARFVTDLMVDGRIRDMTAAMRRTLLLRQRGREARFVTVLEPFRNSAALRQVRAPGPDHIEVSLADGRMHSIEITGLEAGTDPRVSLREHRNGALIREETTA